MFWGHSLWGEKHINKNLQKISGQSRHDFVDILFSSLVFWFPETKERRSFCRGTGPGRAVTGAIDTA